MDKNYITWKQIDELTDQLAQRITDAQEQHNFKYACIIGMPRGGLIPAVMLSHKLGIPLTTKIPKSGVHSLLVDDINDTGTSIMKFLDIHAKGNDWVDVVVLHNKRESKYKDVVYTGEYIGEVWQCYPWETEESSKADYLN